MDKKEFVLTVANQLLQTAIAHESISMGNDIVDVDILADQLQKLSVKVSAIYDKIT